jgi:hypothetical protein
MHQPPVKTTCDVMTEQTFLRGRVGSGMRSLLTLKIIINNVRRGIRDSRQAALD